MQGLRHVRRGAVVGLALTLLALTAISLVGAASTRSSADLVTRAAALTDAYERADDAVAAEESLERKYRLEPSPKVRARHRLAGADLLVALGDVDHRGQAADRQLAGTLRRLHDGYLQAIERMFQAVDARDVATVLRIDGTEVDPAFEHISELVATATVAHQRAAAAALTRLHRVEGLVFVTTAAGFAVGLCLVAAFAAITVGYQRALVRHARRSEHQASHDALTGLPNRTLFADRLQQALGQAPHGGPGSAVLLLDLDRFKEVNDTLGHQYGDDLLCQVGARIAASVRPDDTVARLSGDEFAVLRRGAEASEALALADRILAAVHHSFTLADVLVDVEASVGVAVTTGAPDTAEALLRRADLAMYAAKEAKTGAVLYRPEMHTDDVNRLRLLGDLRRALDAADQLLLLYQPKVGLQFGEVHGVEALIRWQHPTRGLVYPVDFIPMAETTGVINGLTEHVLRMAVGQARAWLDGGRAVQVAVNVSPRCLLDPRFVARTAQLLADFQLPGNLLRLEVTETAVMANPALTLKTLTDLHELGMPISIDDYGTGYSSLAYLKRLPVDELKIDRSFVQSMHTDHDDAVLVRGAVDLGHNLGLTVVAEGVERPAHAAALRMLGCDVAQGYHFGRPMPPAELTAWLGAHDEAAPVQVAGPAADG